MSLLLIWDLCLTNSVSWGKKYPALYSYQGANGTTADTTPGGFVSLASEAPVGSDGMPLANVAGYTVYYGTSSGSYDNKVDNGTQTSCTIRGLAPGTYYIAVTCYDLAGTESTCSNEVSSTVQ